MESDVDAQLTAQLAKWREQLVDLSRRNRLVNLTRTQTSTVTIKHPDLAGVLAGLDRRDGWRFHYPPLPPPADGTDGSDADDIARAVLVLEDPDLDDEIHDDELVTDMPTATRLSGTLRNLERRAIQELMDRGLSILYLAVGQLSWTDVKGDKLRSPLLLVPVLLERGNPRLPFRLRRADADTVANPALAIKLANEFELTLPDFDPDGDDPVGSYLAAVDAVMAGTDWSVASDVVLSYFWFQKEAMYQDLLRNEASILEHPLVRSVATGPGSGESLAFDTPAPDELDQVAPPEQLASILDADSTQRQCILAASEGRTFVMDGPPGTGKSQTIANMISEILATGRTVLFVSEKAPALDVVRSRLDACGLGEFLLEMHSAKTTRKEFATLLGESLEARAKVVGAMSSAEAGHLADVRNGLSRYAAALNRRRDPLGMSLFDAIGRVVSLDEPVALTRPESASELTEDQLARLRSLLGELAAVWGPAEAGDRWVWRELADRDWAFAHVHDIRALIDEQLAAIRALRTRARSDAEMLRLEPPTSNAAAQQLAELIELCGDRPSIHRDWLSTADLGPVREHLASTQRRCEGAAALRSALTGAGCAVDASFDGAIDAYFDVGDQLSTADPRMLPDPDLAIGELRRLADDMRQWAEWLRAANSELAYLARAVGMTEPVNPDPATARTIVVLASFAGRVDRPAPSWFEPATLAFATRAIDEVRSIHNRRARHAASVRKVMTEHVWALDAEALFEDPNAANPELSRFKSAGRRNRKNLAQCAHSGEFTDDVEGIVLDLRAAQRLSRELEVVAATNARVFAGFGSPADPDIVKRFEGAVELIGLIQGLAAPSDVANVSARFVVGTLPDAALADRAEAFGTALDRWEVAARAFPALAVGALAFAEAAPLVDQIAPTLARLADAVDALRPHVPATTLRELDQHLVQLDELRKADAVIERELPTDRALLGSGYIGLQTDWVSLRTGLDWAERVRNLVGDPISAEAAREIELSRFDGEGLTDALRSVEKGNDRLLGLFTADYAQALGDDLESSFVDAEELLADLADHTDQIEIWASHTRLRDQLAGHGWGAIIDDAARQHLSGHALASAVERAVLSVWVDEQIAGDPDLRPLSSAERDALVEEFRRLDRAVTTAAVARVVDTCNRRRPNHAVGAAGVIKRAAMLKRRHPPIRQLIADAAEVILDLKPCVMMSPLAVSQYLPTDLRFDVVIFDEASQVRPCDAVNAIYRGRSLIVAGDNRQLPPTSFFEREMDDGDEWEEGQIDEFESVLDLCKASGSVPSLPLRWHYRSQHESLIAYSNRSFYESKLITFPSSAERHDDVGVELFRVDGVYDRGGKRDNPVEARKVVERVLEHAARRPDASLGVVAFSDAQAQRIEWELEFARKDRRDLDEFFAPHRLDGFFVKNLESVQGDERDVIIFSIGYGPDQFGKLTMNFGPLNREGGERRLNVAITRARRRVEIVSSIDDTMIDETGAAGVRHLKGYLAFARQGSVALETAHAASVGDAESPFEEAVLDRIRSWGFSADSQIGQLGYRIDIGVRHPDLPGRFVLGIECDGAAYHSSPVARDRDRLRSEVLERLGWTLHRVWGPSWYRNQSHESARLRAAIEAAIEGRPRAQTVTPPPHEVTVEVESELLSDGVDGLDFTTYALAPVTVDVRWVDGDRPDLLERAIREIVGVEGPISFATLVARVRRAAAAGRMGSKRQQQVRWALARAIDGGSVVEVETEFYVAPGTEVVVRRPDPNEPDSARTAAEISSTELAAACAAIVGHGRRMQPAELTRFAAATFGWSRQGSQVQERLDAAIALLVDSGVVRRTDDGCLVPTGASESSSGS